MSSALFFWLSVALLVNDSVTLFGTLDTTLVGGINALR